MKITPLKTTDATVSSKSKSLVYGPHGSGKTTQCANYAKRYGKGIILSGEGGLSSISDMEIDYLPFSTFKAEPTKEGTYSFKQLTQYIASDDFRKQKYQWLAIDSVTELSQRCFAEVEEAQKNKANSYDLWTIYGREITAALKWVRDLDMHVVMMALATAKDDKSNGSTMYWPMMNQAKISELLPALFDNVFALLRKTNEQNGKMTVQRYLVTDQIGGWYGKVRDPNRRLAPFEAEHDVTKLLDVIYMDENEFKKRSTVNE